MTWWQAAALTFGAILIVAGAAMAALSALWRHRERKDGLR